MTADIVQIFGNTYAVREQLKALKGRWNPKLKCWDVPAAKAAEARALVAGQPDSRVVDVPLGPHRAGAKNFTASCPVCDGGGGRKMRHLSVLKSDPTTYRCWHGCPPDEIKRALGVDPDRAIRFVL